MADPLVTSAKRRSRERPPPARPAWADLPNPGSLDADKGHMKPWQGKALLRRAAAVLVAAAMGGFTLAGPASADESAMPTAQAVAAGHTGHAPAPQRDA